MFSNRGNGFDMTSPALAGGNRNVRAVPLNYYDSESMLSGQLRDSQTLDLKYAGSWALTKTDPLLLI